MAVFMIGYDLKGHGGRYDEVRDRVEKRISELFRQRRRPIDTTWIVSTTMGADDIHAELREVMGSKDKLFVARLVRGDSTKSEWSGLSESSDDWLERYLRA